MGFSKETLQIIFESLQERSTATNDVGRHGLTPAIRLAAKADCEKTHKAWEEVIKALNDFNKLVRPSDVLKNTHSEITDIRAKLMQALEMLIPTGIVELTEAIAPFITDEEECTRLKAKSTSKDQITLSDDTVISVGDVGTDDLIALVESVNNELK